MASLTEETHGRHMKEGEFVSPSQRGAKRLTESAETSDSAERFSPLHQQHLDAGASFTDFAGWQMPVRYSSELAEHLAVRTKAGLFDLSHMGEIVVLGPQSAQALDYALAGLISAMAIGQAKYSLLLAPDGGILDDLVVYRTGIDRFIIVANASNQAVVAAALLERVSAFDCQVFDESEDIALIALQGPLALEILSQVPGVTVNELSELGFYRQVPANFNGHNLLVARTGYTGEDGFELYLSPDAAPQLWQAIVETGAGSGLVLAGLASRDTLRLEAGMPLYGHELSLNIRPAQAGLGRAVNLTKPGDFVGRAAVEAAPPVGARTLVGLRSNGKRSGRAGYRVLDAAGTEVGAITSGALSPTLGYPIAMAFVDPTAAAIGTALFIDVRGTSVAASVTSLPFYQRKSN